MKRLTSIFAFIFIALGIITTAQIHAQAQNAAEPITIASTTSTQDTGLFSHLLPLFKAKTGIDVKVIAQGTGQALDTGRRGDADVIFVHAKAQEEKFIADGFGLTRFDVMYNDFVLVGPKSDPAKIKNSKDILSALNAIRNSQANFISRGDKSGTHSAELALWKLTGTEIAANDNAGAARWYKSIGQGMGAALNTAAASEAYVLTDRGTWLSFKNRGTLEIIVEGDARLFNQYGIMPVNPAKHPHVKAKAGQAFIDWIISIEGQNAIRSYKIGGEPLFFPNYIGAEKKNAS